MMRTGLYCYSCQPAMPDAETPVFTIYINTLILRRKTGNDFFIPDLHIILQWLK